MGKKKITTLTEEQQKRLVDLRAEWLAVGYSTAPLDRKECTKIIGEFYSRIGKAKPVVLFFSSPMMCILAWGVLKILSSKESQLRSQLRSQLGSQLWSQLRSQLRSQLGSQLWSQLGSQLWSQLGSQLWSQLRSQLGNYAGGNHWCAWEVFYRFCEEIGVKYAEKDSELLDLWLHQSRHLHWWFPYDGIALASERYTVCKVDEQGRLHNPTSAAILYSDGWGIWAWHGVRVDERIIENPETITAKEILAEQNAEIRRVMIERVGMERFLGEAGAQCIHRHNRGELFSIDLPGDPERVLRSVRVTDPSTGRVYFLRVPPYIKRADDAVAWTFGFDIAKEYKPEVET